jgi:pimeloyl-ACP methyl ester carboxylesterase
MVVKATTKYEKYAKLTAGRTRYLEAGTGPPLIMLHGMGAGTSANSFDFVLEPLAEHFHVYAMDMLGFGRGDRTIVDGPTFSLIIDHVREFMDSQGIERASFVGHSAGGWMLTIMAYESPERVAKLVMLNSAGMNVEVSAGVGPVSQLPTLEQIRERVGGGMADDSKVTSDMLDQIAAAQDAAWSTPGAQHSLDPLLHQMATPEIRERYLLQRRLPHIKAKTLVVWGVGDTMDPYPTWTKEYEALDGDMSKSTKPWVIPGARHVLLQTGHGPQTESADETAKLLIDFLKS